MPFLLKMLSRLAGLRWSSTGRPLLTVNGNAVGTVDDFVTEINACSKRTLPMLFSSSKGESILYLSRSSELGSFLKIFISLLLVREIPSHNFIFLGISVTVFGEKILERHGQNYSTNRPIM